jgi:hypothetical protein
MTALIFYLAFAVSNFTSAVPAAPERAISPQEKADLLYLREEEKLAHDVYVFSYAKYGHVVFSNISESELRHTNSVLGLLNQYGIPDPANGRAEGEFQHPELQKLYDDLTHQSGKSLIEAFKVGATIEDLDIYDIARFYAHTTHPEFTAVYDRLTCGSRNHMRAFVSQLRAAQVNYAPQYIARATFDGIVNGPHERCGARFQNAR